MLVCAKPSIADYYNKYKQNKIVNIMVKVIKLTEGDINNMVIETINTLKGKETIKESFRSKHRRPRNINEDVMKRFWNIDNQCAPVLVEGITIDRLMKKHGDNGFVIISANRSDESDERNTKATQELIRDLKNSGFAYLPSYGGYHGTDDVVDSFEPNFTVFNYDTKGNPTDFEDLYRFALDMCGKYGQDSVYINAPGKAPEYHNAQGEKVNDTSSRDYIKNDLSQEFYTTFSSPDEISRHGKTQPIGRGFTSDIQFEGKIYVNPMPSSNTARMRRKGEVMIWS